MCRTDSKNETAQPKWQRKREKKLTNSHKYFEFGLCSSTWSKKMRAWEQLVLLWLSKFNVRIEKLPIARLCCCGWCYIKTLHFFFSSLHSSVAGAPSLKWHIEMAGSNGVPYKKKYNMANVERKRENRWSYQHTIYSITATHIYNMCIEMISGLRYISLARESHCALQINHLPFQMRISFLSSYSSNYIRFGRKIPSKLRCNRIFFLPLRFHILCSDSGFVRFVAFDDGGGGWGGSSSSSNVNAIFISGMSLCCSFVLY